MHLIRRRAFFALTLSVAALILGFAACSRSDGTAEKGRVTSSGPAGVFFMTRYWSGGPLEKAAWYFAADGTVFQNLESGVTAADLAAHKGPKGAFKLTGGDIEIKWADGKTSRSQFERDKNGRGFAWDGGLFSPVDPIADPKLVSGKFEGGESLSHGGNSIRNSHTFVFRADGTYTREDVGAVKGATDRTILSGGSSGAGSGTWKADGFTIVLTPASGAAERKMAFLWSDDDKQPPNRLYLGGTLLKRQ
jgi:hypothetical protein